MKTTRDSAASSPAEQRIELAAAAAVDRLGRMRLRARSLATGSAGGRRRSSLKGRSIEFREHRPYARGDDLRLVDWRAWARHDRLYVKQHDDETNLRVTLLVDASGSMAYGEEAASKGEYAAVAGTTLAQLWLGQQDAVGVGRLNGETNESLPPSGGATQARAIARLLAAPPSEAALDLGKALQGFAVEATPRSLAVLISDLLAPPRLLEEGLKALRARQVEVFVLQVMHDDEIDFPLAGPTRFVSLESAATLDADPRALRRKYLAALDRHQAAIASVCEAQSARHQLARTSEPVEAALSDVLASLGR